MTGMWQVTQSVTPAALYVQFHIITAMYSTVKVGLMCTWVAVTERKGVWHVQNFYLDSSDSEIKNKLVSDFPRMQPWNQSDFFLVELSLGDE